jgi:LmbE family N-acetylglucosaminyl deacetylase
MQIRTPAEISGLGTILSVWAHPDDETYSCAGVMAQAVKNGQRVVCVTATKGEAGSQDETKWPSATLADVRAGELKNALSILGITEHHWLNYPDGGCKNIPEQEAVDTIAEFIKEVNPDTILTFEPNGVTGHDDHRAVARWVTLAAKKMNSNAKIYCNILTDEEYNDKLKEADKQFNIFFNTDQPVTVPQADCDILLRLDEDLHELKMRALRAMPSQTEAMFNSPIGEEVATSLTLEAFISADKLK